MASSNPRYAWVVDHASSYLQDVRGHDEFTRWLRRWSVNATPLGPFMKMWNIVNLVHNFSLPEAGMSSITVELTMYDKTMHISYRGVIGMAYWVGEDQRGDPDFVCVGPSFESRDGEFRIYVRTYREFISTYESVPETGQIETAFARKISKLFDFDVLGTGPRGDKLARKTRERRLPLKMLVSQWMRSVALPMSGIHEHPTLREAMTEFDVVGGRHFNPRILGGPRVINDGLRIFRGAVTPHGLGQKLTPLSILEVVHPDNLMYPAWREKFIGQLCTSLILAGRTDSLPASVGSTIMSGGRDRRIAEIFANRHVLERYRRHDKATAAVRHLTEARESIQMDGQRHNHPDGPALAFAEEAIYDAMVAIQSRSQMSDSVHLQFTETVGGTLETVVSQSRGQELLNIIKSGQFVGITMDIAFALMVLHRSGVIHTDLHRNNVTICDRHVDPRTMEHKAWAYAHVASTEGQVDTYVYTYDSAVNVPSYRGNVIDFSRCLLGHDALRLAGQWTESFAVLFNHKQAERIQNICVMYAPTVAKEYGDRLYGLMFSNPEGVLKALRAVDYIALAHGIASLKVAPTADGAAAPSAETRLPIPVTTPAGDTIDWGVRMREVEHSARRLLVTHLAALVEKPETVTSSDIDLEIFEVMFPEWRHGAWPRDVIARAQVVRAFVADAPIGPIGVGHDMLPPYLRQDSLVEHWGESGYVGFLRGMPVPRFSHVQEEMATMIADAYHEVAPPTGESTSGGADDSHETAATICGTDPVIPDIAAVACDVDESKGVESVENVEVSGGVEATIIAEDAYGPMPAALGADDHKSVRGRLRSDYTPKSAAPHGGERVEDVASVNVEHGPMY